MEESSQNKSKNFTEIRISDCKGGISSQAVYFSSVIRKLSRSSLNIVIVDNKKSSYFFVSDLYNFFNEECVYFFPPSTGDSSRNSIKNASLKVQRTASLSAIDNYNNGPCDKEELNEALKNAGNIIDRNLIDKQNNSQNGPVIIVGYPEALDEKVLKKKTVRESIISISKGEKVSHDFISEVLFNFNFKEVDFVSEPGEFALRGSIIDIFSFANNNPYRIDFFGEEVESIGIFDSNTQRTIKEIETVDIYPNLYENFNSEDYVDIYDILPEGTLLWDFRTDLNINRGEENINSLTSVIPQPAFNKNFDVLYDDIRLKEEKGYKVHILSPNLNQTVRLQGILQEKGGDIHPDFMAISIHEGYIDNISRNCYYTDHQIFERYHKIKMKREVARSERLAINDLSSFQIGDYVVHIDHGVGQFGGLVKTNINGKIQEAVKLVYKDNDVIFVSIHGIHRISKYKSREGDAPKIYKLGTKAWDNLKNSTKSKVKDIAKELIKLYSERMHTRGFAFSDDNYMQKELESSFMYEDTEDQQKATQAVKADMEDIHPMDRLICGDVGFGKTEIAIRAAFKAVCDNKQVAVLVPTTILALQHYQTFKARLKDFPCNIDYISRLRTAKEVREIGEKIKTGKTDILIGTHKILNKDLQFKDLGLLIVDEEQKFGVTSKEKLRQLKANVDTLTLTATPIPRTLQFSLLGARDLSIINTPPPNRLPVYTEIIDFNEDKIKEIIESEVERGGQIFFVHNKVEDILSVEAVINRICPKVKTAVAHGQMAPGELEERIMDFMDGDYDLLVCTSIIENGLDIPNANTMIIHQAQNFGLSDLHQLRGRVGRSNVKAYCYLIVPPMISLTYEAKSRLNAIETFSDLGSGFNIAMQDLDIRGAGNLLGAEQSGFIAEMGFETYQKILNEALVELSYEEPSKVAIDGDKEESVDEIKGEKYLNDCQIDTDMEVLIPDSYINITAEKIRLYKELDGMSTEEELKKFADEMTDRFGPLPQPLSELMNIVRLRGVAMQLGIERIVLKNNIMIAYFICNQMSPFYQSRIFSHIIDYLQHSRGRISIIEQNKKLYIKVLNVNSVEIAVALLREMLPLSPQLHDVE